MTTERNFDHLDAIGERHPIVLAQTEYNIHPGHSGYSLMKLVQAGFERLVLEQNTFHISAVDACQSLGEKLLELSTGAPLKGTLKLESINQERIGSRFTLTFSHAWTEVTVRGRQPFFTRVQFWID